MRPTLLQIANTKDGRLICDRARLADTFLTRLVGLIGQRGLEDGDGLWITPSSGVHTWSMSFPIDILALDGGLRVVDSASDVGPWRIAGLSWKTRSVLELPAGQIARSGISIGDRLSVVREQSCWGVEEAHGQANSVNVSSPNAALRSASVDSSPERSLNTSWDGSARALIRGQNAQSLIEVAIFLPIFITLICYAIDFGYFFLVAATLDSATRNGVEYSVQGGASPSQASVPSASAVSTLTTLSIGLPGATSSTVSIRVCSSSVGVNSTTNTTQCSTPQSGAGAVSGTPDTDPESPTFLLNRVDAVYTVTPPVPMPASLLPSMTFRRAAEMRSVQ